MSLIEMKNIEKAKKAIEFLKILSKDLNNFKFIKTQRFIIQPGKVSYFDVLTETYKLYDYTEFNHVMCKTYYNEILKHKIEKNEFFSILKSNMDIIHSRSKHRFYDDIYNTFHLVSWFVKSLRHSKTIEDKFDTNGLINQFPFPFLEKGADLTANIEFLIDYINLLQEKKIIQIIDLQISFVNCDYLDDFINFSFEQLVFGGDLYLDKCILTPEKIDISILNDDEITDDYKFNYVVSFATNYISYDNCSNNLFVENIKYRV